MFFESQACRRRSCVVEKRCTFFEKARFGVPKPCLRRFKLAASIFCYMILFNVSFYMFCVFCQHVVNIVPVFHNICQYLSIYGTAYLPTDLYCVPYGTAYLPISLNTCDRGDSLYTERVMK